MFTWSGLSERVHLATGVSVNLTACQLHFPPIWLMKQTCLYHVSGLSQIWSSRLYMKTIRLCGRITVQLVSLVSLFVNVKDMPVGFPGQSGTL